MDVLNKKILKELQKNNRVSSEKLGQKVGLSATACQRRLKKIRASNVIAKEVAVLNDCELNNYVTIIVEIVMKRGTAHAIDGFKQIVLDHPHVQQCFYITGKADFILVITSKNMLEYEKLTKTLLLSNPDIQKFHSTVVMENVKRGLDIPI